MLLLETEQVKHSISELNLKVPRMPFIRGGAKRLFNLHSQQSDLCFIDLVTRYLTW